MFHAVSSTFKSPCIWGDFLSLPERPPFDSALPITLGLFLFRNYWVPHTSGNKWVNGKSFFWDPVTSIFHFLALCKAVGNTVDTINDLGWLGSVAELYNGFLHHPLYADTVVTVCSEREWCLLASGDATWLGLNGAAAWNEEGDVLRPLRHICALWSSAHLIIGCLVLSANYSQQIHGIVQDQMRQAHKLITMLFFFFSLWTKVLLWSGWVATGSKTASFNTIKCLVSIK